MSDNIEHIMPDQFRGLDQRLENIENDVGDIKLRINAVEAQISTLVMSVAGVNHRLELKNASGELKSAWILQMHDRNLL